MLHVSVAELDDALRTTANLPKILADLKKNPAANPEYAKLSLEQIESDIRRQSILCRAGALQALYELAMMPINASSGQNQVKLAAASRLYQDTGDQLLGTEVDMTLRALNDAYHQNAPRIKSIRERTIEFESEPKLVSDQ